MYTVMLTLGRLRYYFIVYVLVQCTLYTSIILEYDTLRLDYYTVVVGFNFYFQNERIFSLLLLLICMAGPGCYGPDTGLGHYGR